TGRGWPARTFRECSSCFQPSRFPAFQPPSLRYRVNGMTRIGIVFGMEQRFPPAVVDRINKTNTPDVLGEFVSVGAVVVDEPTRYRVIMDRISHVIPFYRAYLKNAVLAGTTVINNPFWWSADDKFFNYALATRLGVAIPPTVILPHK